MSKIKKFICTNKKISLVSGLALLSGSLFAIKPCSSIIDSFGELPKGTRLERIKTSPNYVNGEFQYYVPSPLWTESRLDYVKEKLFGEHKQIEPLEPLPILKTNLASLDKEKDFVVWLGHSTLFIQLAGKRILIDPVFSSYTSPVSFISSSFKGAYPYSVEELPEIDYVIISHDHWDHLDYPTIIGLKDKIKAAVMPLGIGAHFEKWGYDSSRLHEADWGEDISLDSELIIHVLPARHFSGRGLININQTLWASFLIETPTKKIFYSGDGGYGPHFADIGKRFGSIDLAIMENGQYDSHWSHVHMLPEEAVQAAMDLNAKQVLPVHTGRFALASHTWDEPYKRIDIASEGKNFSLLTPKMGQVVDLNNSYQNFMRWWQKTE